MDNFWISVKQITYLLVIFLCVNESFVTAQSGAGTLYRGKYIGRLQARQHKVSGEVYAVDAKTLHIRAFTYDGTGPDAFFWAGFTEHPSPQGIIVPDEKGTKAVLGAYNAQDITLTLPDGLLIKDIKWFSVWCRAYEVNFGDLYIPSDLDYPQPHVIGSLTGGQHAVASGPIVVVDAQTILVPDFTYDGQAPDVHFWVGRGKPGPDGIRVPDETGGDTPLVKSDKKTMVLTLPGDLTIFDIDYFGVWCASYYVDFGHVKILSGLNVPPSLRMLGVTPQTKLNCEVLWDDLALEIRWAVAGESIVMQFVGRVDDGQYMSFGLSGDDSRSIMIGGDALVGWFDKSTGRGHVVDYYLDSKSQCSGRRGTCPDSRLQAEANNVRLLSATVVNGFTMLTFQRPLQAHDELDKTILTNGSQPVIWAVGPINQRDEASYHTLRNRDDLFIDFGRVPRWNCPAPEPEITSPTRPTLPVAANITSNRPGVVVQLSPEPRPVEVGVPIPTTTRPIPQPQLKPSSTSSTSAWNVPPILCHEPEDRVFYAQMGPTGGKRGYSAITGHIGWGISWYINGLLVPEVYVVRGQTYTFVVEGGDNPEVPARYHPLYITDDPEGGYQYKTQVEKNSVKVFAGVGIDSHGKSLPTSTGRLCQWTEHNDKPADTFTSYGSYQRSLSLHCDEGVPGVLNWTPNESTPDVVYYQCYTHRYLGWKIRVVDSCEGDQVVESSENVPLPLPIQIQTTDQEIGETIVHGTKTVLIPKLFNDVKAGEVKGMDAVDSTPETPSYPVDVPSSNLKLTDRDTILSERSLLNEKQEPGIIYQTQSPGPIPLHKQEYQRPPESSHYSQNVFIRGPEEMVHSSGLSQQHVLYSHPSFTSLPYPTDSRAQVVRNSHPFKFVDAYGQRVRVGDGSRIFYETKPGSEYVIGPRNPVVAHSVRYEGVPSMILASTISPQIISNPGYETRNKGDYSTVQQQQSRVQEAPLLQGAVVRLKDVRLRPEQIALSSETVKFIDYPPPHLRIAANEGGFRNNRPPNWPHSRSLPKREEIRTDEEEQIPTLEEIQKSLKIFNDNDSPFEIIKVNDPNLLPFEQSSNLSDQIEQNIQLLPYGTGQFSTGKQSGIVARHKSTPGNSSAAKFYVVDDLNHVTKDETVGGRRTVVPHAHIQRIQNISEQVDSSNSPIMFTFPRQVLTGSQGENANEMKSIDEKMRLKQIPFFYTIEPKENDWLQIQKSLKVGLQQGHELKETGFDPGTLMVQSGFHPASDASIHIGNYKIRDLISPPIFAELDESPKASSPATTSSFDSAHHDKLSNGFRDPQLENFEPVFRPSLPDAGGFNMSQYGAHALESTIHLPIIVVPGMEKVSTVMTQPINLSAPRNTLLLHRLGGQIIKQEYPTIPHGSQRTAYQSVKRHPASSFNGHDIERVSESQDLTPEANQRAPLSIISQPGGNNMRPAIPRLPQPPPGTVLAFDGRHVSLNNGGINFRPNSDGLTPSIQNKPQFVTYRGELPSSLLEIAENFPHLNSQNSRHPFRHVPKVQEGDIQTLSSDRFYTSVSAKKNGNHNLISSKQMPRLSSNLEIVPNDDITMVVVKGSDDKELQRELPKIISQVQKDSQGETSQRQQAQFEASGRFESPLVAAESEESFQMLHAYKNPTQIQQNVSPRQDVPQNNTDLHILTDIWSIINNQDDPNVGKLTHPQVAYRPINPNRSGLPIRNNRPSQLQSVPHRRM